MKAQDRSRALRRAEKGDADMNDAIGRKLVGVGVLALLGLLFISSTIVVVDAGHTGVKKTLGKVASEAYPPGLYLVMPFVSSITQMDNRVMKFEDKTAVYTKDVQQADISYVLNYNLMPGTSVEMYSTVGMNWAYKLIPQVITASMKNVIGQWNALELVSNRIKASQDIQDMISDDLKKEGIRVTAFSLTNIDFQPQFEQAVEAKVVAVQNAEMAKNQTVQVQEQANQRVIAAKADAEAMKIKTDALNKNQSLIMYEAVQKWNGELPKILTGSGAGSILNIPPSALGSR
ncbi:MAG: hypothetical protein GC185_11835 [Alphaproteobacteria bacterium]|nr:hypothetical protein [Alphaproteobacteria bacterium]